MTLPTFKPAAPPAPDPSIPAPTPDTSSLPPGARLRSYDIGATLNADTAAAAPAGRKAAPGKLGPGGIKPANLPTGPGNWQSPRGGERNYSPDQSPHWPTADHRSVAQQRTQEGPPDTPQIGAGSTNPSDPVNLAAQVPPGMQGQSFGQPTAPAIDWGQVFQGNLSSVTVRGLFQGFMGNPVVEHLMTGAGLGMTGMFVGGMFGPEVALPLGALGAAYGLWQGNAAFDQSTPVGKLLAPLDWLRHSVERFAGTTAQVGGAALATAFPDAGLQKEYGTLPEVLTHLKEAWDAAGSTYAAFSPAGLSKILPSAWGTPNGTWVDYDLPNAPDGLAALVTARRILSGWNGAPPITDPTQISQVEAMTAAQFGAPGQIRELASGFLADPLMQFPLASTKAIGIVAELTGNADLAMVTARMLEPHPYENLPFGIKGPSWLTHASGEGIAPTMQAYKNFLMSEKVFRAGFDLTTELTRFERYIVGDHVIRLATEGTYTPPKWSGTNPLTWVTYNLSQTPESMAREAVYQFSNNVQAYLSSLDWTRPETPQIATDMISGWKNAPETMPESFPQGGNIPLTIEGRIYRRVLPDAVVADLNSAYQATRDMAQAVQAMAEALNVEPKQVLDQIGPERDQSAALLTKLQATGAPGMELVTPEALDGLKKIFVDGGVPLTVDAFHAALMSKLVGAAGNWATSTYGVHAMGLTERFAAAAKAAESAALLGLNITYPVRNALNGEVMMAVAGAYGMKNVKDIMAELDRAGIAPARLRAGLGAADVGDDNAMAEWGANAAKQGLRPITSAVRGEDAATSNLTKFRDTVSGFVQQMPATKAAQWVERTQSARAYYEGFTQFLGQVWRRGIGIPRMPDDLIAELTALDPRLPNAIYAAAESSLNPMEIAAKVLTDRPVMSTAMFTADVAARLGIAEGDVHRLLAVDGLGTKIDDALTALGPNPKVGDVTRIFGEARNLAEHSLDVLSAAEVQAQAEHAAAVVQTEGASAMMNLFSDVETRLSETYTNHTIALGQEWDEISRANPLVRDILIQRMRVRSAQTWSRFFDFQAAMYDGIAHGLTANPAFKAFSKSDFTDVLAVQRADILKFHTLKDNLRDSFFSGPWKGDEAYTQLQIKEGRLYDALINRIDKRTGKLDGYLQAWAQYHAGPEYAQRVGEWRDTLRTANIQDMRDVAAFRQSLIGADKATRNAKWLTFQDGRLSNRYAIERQALDQLHGLGAAPTFIPPPQQPGQSLRPGTWWQDLAEKYGLNYTRKDGTPHWQHFVRAVNKYLPEPLIGQAVKFTPAEIAGLPAPDRIATIVNALENRASVKGGTPPAGGPNAPWAGPTAPEGDGWDAPVAPTQPPNPQKPGGPGAANVPSNTPPPGVAAEDWQTARNPGTTRQQWIDFYNNNGPDPTTLTARYPVMITRDQTQQLMDLGWSREKINQMTPATAHEYIGTGFRPPAGGGIIDLNARSNVATEQPVTPQPVAPEGKTPTVPPGEIAPGTPPPPEHAGSEQRLDWARRAQIEAMTPEQRAEALNILRQNTGSVDTAHVHELTGFPTKGAWADGLNGDPARLDGKVLVHADVAGLGWFNDTFGHNAGDALLKEFANQIKAAGLADRAYHISGDEFNFAFDTLEQAQSAMTALKQALREGVWSIQDTEGNTHEYSGASYTYGIGAGDNSLTADAAAERELIQAKRDAIARGERPASKGARPGGLGEVTPGQGAPVEAGNAQVQQAESPANAHVAQPGEIPLSVNGGQPGNVVPPELIGRYQFQGGESISWQSSPYGNLPETLTGHVALPQANGAGTILVDRSDGTQVEITASRVTDIKTNIPPEQFPLRPDLAAVQAPPTEPTAPAPTTGMAEQPTAPTEPTAKAQTPVVEPSGAAPLEPPVQVDVQAARNATAEFVDMQQANADLIEPPSHLFHGVQYILPNVPDELIDWRGSPRELAQLTLDQRMALERGYLEKYQRAMGRDTEHFFSADIVKRIIKDHYAVLAAADGDRNFIGGDRVLWTDPENPSRTREGVIMIGANPGEEARVRFGNGIHGNLVSADDLEIIGASPDRGGTDRNVRPDVWASMAGDEQTLIRKFADPEAPSLGIGKLLGRDGVKVGLNGQAVDKQTGDTIGAGATHEPPTATAAVRGPGQNRPGQPGPTDQGALGEVPAQDVRGPGAPGATPAVRPGDAEQGGRNAGAVAPEERPLELDRGNNEPGVAPAGREGSAEPAVRPGRIDAPGRSGLDYRITDADQIGVGGAKSKYKDNIAAITLLKQIEAEGRLATPAEQQVLVKYVGWGGIKQVFDTRFGYSAGEWSKQFAELKNLLTDEEYTAASHSVLNAHYTSPVVINAIYAALDRLGFSGGRLLEPALGVGHFFGLMPPEMAAASQRVGIELDSLTARIAKQLYQAADIRNLGFEDSKLPKKFFDVVTSNVPFGGGVYDSEFMKGRRALTAHIHDYYFAKSLDLVRDGGLVAFITSNGTLNKLDPSVRAYIADRADFLGAIRLPSDTFKGNAGTEVTTDIVFLQKRATGQAPAGESMVGSQKLSDGLVLNEYFQRHPEMMLGTPSMQGTMNGPGKEFTLTAIPGHNLQAELDGAIQRLPQSVYRDRGTGAAPVDLAPPEALTPTSAKEGSYQIQDGKVYQVQNGQLAPAGKRVTPGGVVETRIKGLAGVRDQGRAVLDLQTSAGATPEALATARARLNEVYDSFVKANGPIHLTANLRALAGDPDLPFIASLENYDPDTGRAQKADIFTHNTTMRREVVAHADTPKDALIVTMNEKGRLDLQHMSELLGQPREQIAAQLVDQGLAYHNPEGAWETADQYLSGKVRAKLAAAEAAAKIDPSYAPNVAALRSVQPVDVPADQINIKLGANWVPTKVVEQFIDHLLDSPDQTSITYIEPTNTWNVTAAKWSLENNQTWAAGGQTALDLIHDSLDQKLVSVYDTVKVPDGQGGTTERRVFNSTDTIAARAMQAKIKDEYRNWILSDPARAEGLARLYNDKFNDSTPREFDGSHLTLPGAANEFVPGGARALYPHQLNAIWRVVSSGQNTLLDHVVGAGKTYEMIGAGMELKRLGLAQKPMYVVPNHLLEQWGGDFNRMYPNANVLLAGADDFSAANRQALMAKIATGNWDAVIVGHSSFGMIPVSDETWNGYVQGQLADLEDALRAARSGPQDRLTVRQLEQAKQTLLKKLRTQAGIIKKDDLLTFEQLGVDQLFVDEAHKFKNLMYTTRMTGVKGMGDPKGSGKAFDMFVKSQYLTNLNNGRGVVFATGTPISNSLVETYTMQKYMQAAQMRELGILNFDNWVANFANTRTEMGLSVDGKTYQPVTGLYEYTNAPEAIKMFRDFADVQTADMLNLPTPDLIGGKPEPVAVPGTPEMLAYRDTLVARAKAIKEGRVGKGPGTDNMLWVSSDGRKAALDMRLIDPSLPDNPNYKTSIAAQHIYDIWKDGQARRTTQLVFSDFSTPGKDHFNVYDDLKAKLVARGVPANEIAFIHDYGTDAQKTELFRAVNDGKIRVLIGSTEKMGAGMNVQKLLVAEHHLDAPWHPGDVEQRDGRIMRQGNDNAQVYIKRYLTEGSFDAFMWQTLKDKQSFITKLQQGKLDSRTITDTSTPEMSYEEMKAVASGDPLVRDKFQNDSEVARLTSLAQAHADRQRVFNRDLRDIPRNMANDQSAIEAAQAAYSYFKAHRSDPFSMTIGPDRFDTPEAAGKRLFEVLDQVRAAGSTMDTGTLRQAIGEVHGYKLNVELQVVRSGSDFSGIRRNITTRFYLENPDGFRVWADPTGTPLGTAQKLTRVLEDLPVSVKQLQDAKAFKAANLEKVKAELAKPFAYDAELAQAQARQAEIMARLTPKDPNDPHGGNIIDLGSGGDQPPPDVPPTTDPLGVGGGDVGAGQTYQVPGRGTFRIEGWDPASASYVVRRLDDNTVHLIAKGADGSMPFLGSGQFDQATGGAPMPVTAPKEESWYGKMLPMLDELQKRAEYETRLPPIAGANGLDNPQTRMALQQYLSQVEGAMAQSKLGAMKWGEFKRDLALLNYSRRYNIDTLAGQIFPYEFWMTHSLSKWALHAMDQPALLANYYRIQKFLNTEVTQPGFPQALAGKIRVPVPWMPKWMGGSIYFDPTNIGLPLNYFLAPFQQAQYQTNSLVLTAQREIHTLVAQGKLSQAEADQALATQTGPAWQNALAMAQNATKDNQMDGLDLASLMVRPHLPLSWAYDFARGKQAQIPNLPITKEIRGATAMAGIGGPGGVNLEGGIRSALSMPVFDQFEDYRIDRTLSDMVAEGLITVQQAQAAMIDRQGQVFDMATHRSAVQGAMGTLTGYILGSPAQIFPEGEQRQRLLGTLFSAARLAQDAGDTSALNKFFAAHPDYAARLSVNQTPAKRLQNFMVDNIWVAWNNLPDLYRHEVQKQFGPVFDSAFLSKQTRNYDSIPTATLAQWAKTLGTYIPTAAGDVTQLPMNWAPAQVAQVAQQYYEQRKAFGPGPLALEKQYFAIPTTDKVQLPVPPAVASYLDTIAQKFPNQADLFNFYDNLATTRERSRFMRDHPEMRAYDDYRAWWRRQNPAEAKLLGTDDVYKGNAATARSQFLLKYPELKAYWDWGRAWKAAHPDAVPYITETQPQSATTTSGAKPTSEPSGVIAAPETQRIVTAYLFSATPLDASTRAALEQAYQENNTDKTKSFDQWLMETMAYGGVMEGPASVPGFNPPVQQAAAP